MPAAGKFHPYARDWRRLSRKMSTCYNFAAQRAQLLPGGLLPAPSHRYLT